MKLLGIAGSNRKNGNTEYLVKKALQAAEKEGSETECISLADYEYSGCIGCEGCRDTYRCVLKDDMQKLYPKIREADALILGSPTYFYNISSKMKAFIDRMYCYEIFHEKDRSCWLSLQEVLGIKYAAVIAVCEQLDEKDMGFAAEAVKMPFEALGYRVVDVVKVINVFNRGEVKEREKSIIQAENAAKKIVLTLKLREEVRSKQLSKKEF